MKKSQKNGICGKHFQGGMGNSLLPCYIVHRTRFFCEKYCEIIKTSYLLEHLYRIDQIPKPNTVENIKTRHLVEKFLINSRNFIFFPAPHRPNPKIVKKIELFCLYMCIIDIAVRTT